MLCMPALVSETRYIAACAIFNSSAPVSSSGGYGVEYEKSFQPCYLITDSL